MSFFMVFIPYIACTFCDKKWSVATTTARRAVIDALLPTHLALHTTEMVAEMQDHMENRCGPCRRLKDAPAGAPHRPCFEATCLCPCSHTKPEEAQ